MFPLMFFDTELINMMVSLGLYNNKAGYTATPVACGWAGAIFEVT